MIATTLAAGGLLTPNAGLIFWIVIAFSIFLFILGKFAWGPITSALRERENTIEESITRAEKALAEAKAMQADNEKQRREAEREAQRILAEARDDAQALREREADKTKADIARMQEQAKKDIENETQRAIGELRQEVAGLAIGAAEKILRENLDASRQQKLVDAFLTEMPKN